MNALNKVRESIYGGYFETVNKATLYTAYLQLHHDNPGLHPDDYLDPGCGYCGWHVSLMIRVLGEAASLPDEFHYPAFMLPAERRLVTLHSFHNDDDDDAMQVALDVIGSFLHSMWTSAIPEVMAALQTVIAFHDGSAAEDILEPFRTMLEVLEWVNQFN